MHRLWFSVIGSLMSEYPEIISRLERLRERRFAEDDGLALIVALVESYFHAGGLHLQFNVLDAGRLAEAMAMPEHHADLIVRVTGFSAYFTRLTRNVQEDLIRRYHRDVAS